jgi:hypothetical protein
MLTKLDAAFTRFHRRLGSQRTLRAVRDDAEKFCQTVEGPTSDPASLLREGWYASVRDRGELFGGLDPSGPWVTRALNHTRVVYANKAVCKLVEFVVDGKGNEELLATKSYSGRWLRTCATPSGSISQVGVTRSKLRLKCCTWATGG